MAVASTTIMFRLFFLNCLRQSETFLIHLKYTFKNDLILTGFFKVMFPQHLSSKDKAIIWQTEINND